MSGGRGAQYGFSVDINGNAVHVMRTIQAELKKLGIDATVEATRVKKAVGSIVEDTKKSFGSLKAMFYTGAGLAAGLFIKDMVSAGTKVEDATTGLTTLLKSSAEAKQVIANVMDDAMKTPFAFEGLLMANKALISANVNAKSARVAVLDLANAIAATGGGDDELQRMVVNMQQIKNTGKASAMDIKQFAFAGVNIYEVLAKYTGKTAAQTKEMKVSYELLTAALHKAAGAGGIYADGLKNMQNNVSVQMSNLGDALFQLKVQMFQDLRPAIVAIIGALMQLVTGLKSLWKWFTGTSEGAKIFRIALVALAGGWLLYKVATLGSIAATKLATLAQWDLNAAMMANPIGFIIALIVALAAGFMYLWDRSEKFRAGWMAMWEITKKVITGMMNQLMDFGRVLDDLVHGRFSKLSADFKKAADDMKKDLFSGWGDAVAKGLKEGAESKFRFGDLLKIGTGQNGPSAEAIGGGKSGAKGSAINTSDLAGAKGGLGEAKIINIHIDTMQKVSVMDGKGLKAAGQDAIEVMLRTLNNIAYSQSATQ